MAEGQGADFYEITIPLWAVSKRPPPSARSGLDDFTEIFEPSAGQPSLFFDPQNKNSS